MFASTSTFLTVLALLASSTQALYFTSPQASTVWDSAVGQTMTWHPQSGDAPVGTFVLVSAADNTKTTIAKSVTLSTGSLVFPSGVSLASSTSLYKILIVNAADPTYTYSSVGPFTINSFSSSSSSSPGTSPQVASPVLPTPIIPVTEGSPRSATQPGVSTATPAATTPLAISTVVASSARMTSSGMVTSVITSSSSSSSSSSASSSATRSTATALNATSTPAAASASSANSVVSRGGTMLFVFVVMCASLLILS